MHPFLTAFLSQTAPAAPDAQAQPGFFTLPNLMLMAAFGLAFYFIMYRPRAAEQKKQQEMLAKLEKGHEVLTQSGFIARVVSIEDQHVMLDLGGGTKAKMFRAYILRNLTLEAEAKAAQAEAKKK